MNNLYTSGHSQILRYYYVTAAILSECFRQMLPSCSRKVLSSNCNNFYRTRLPF